VSAELNRTLTGPIQYGPVLWLFLYFLSQFPEFVAHGRIRVNRIIHFIPTVHYGGMIAPAEISADLVETALYYVSSQVYSHVAGGYYRSKPRRAAQLREF
jgi:hypothetical protein